MYWYALKRKLPPVIYCRTLLLGILIGQILLAVYLNHGIQSLDFNSSFNYFNKNKFCLIWVYMKTCLQRRNGAHGFLSSFILEKALPSSSALFVRPNMRCFISALSFRDNVSSSIFLCVAFRSLSYLSRSKVL